MFLTKKSDLTVTFSLLAFLSWNLTSTTSLWCKMAVLYGTFFNVFKTSWECWKDGGGVNQNLFIVGFHWYPHFANRTSSPRYAQEILWCTTRWANLGDTERMCSVPFVSEFIQHMYVTSECVCFPLFAKCLHGVVPNLVNKVFAVVLKVMGT